MTNFVFLYSENIITNKPEVNSIPSNALDSVAALGSLIELKAIALRDTYKIGPSIKIEHNCYYEWLKVTKTHK